MSSEREADRALKRQVDPVALCYLSPNMLTVYELAWHSSRPRRKSWERKRLTVRSFQQISRTNGFSLTSPGQTRRLSTHFTVLWLFLGTYDLIHAKLHAIVIGTLLGLLFSFTA
jgi:hypothetical protein